MEHLTLAHWVYLFGVVAIIGAVVARKNVVIPAVVATIATSLAYSGGDILSAIASVFNASFVASTTLYAIFLTIALVTALLGSLKNIGADQLMVKPFEALMRGGMSAYIVLAAATFGISLFFWPTPALPLLGAILVPAAIRAGLSPVGCAIAIALSGQGMALAADYVMGVAPSLSAEGAGVSADLISNRALILSVTVGLVALPLAYFWHARHWISAPSPENLTAWLERSEATDTVELEKVAAPQRSDFVEAGYSQPLASGSGGDGSVPFTSSGIAGSGGSAGASGAEADESSEPTQKAKIFAAVVPLAFLTLLVCMILGKTTDLFPDLKGGQGAALIGGSSVVLMAIAAIAHRPSTSLDDAADHIVDGLVFAFKAMGVVIPIAGFIFIGIPLYADQILGVPGGTEAPGFLFDLIRSVEGYIPNSTIGLVFAMLIIGMLIGLDGNGWAGLPLTGTFAAGLAHGGDSQVATLAAMAQVSATWTGGGTLLIWSSLVAVAGITRTSVVDLARRLFLPVMCGFFVAGLVATLLMEVWV